MAKTAVFIVKGDDFKGIEGETAVRVMRRLFREGGEAIDIVELDRDSPFKIEDLRRYKGYDVFVIIHGILFITRAGITCLSTLAKKSKEGSVIVPVSNEAGVSDQRCAPPFLYQTVSVFTWAAEEIQREFSDIVVEVDETDEYCFAFKRKVLDALPGDRNVIELPRTARHSGLRLCIARGVYAHRYGDCYESGREDLIERVPLNAQKILDVGSARGHFGELLKKRQRCEVTGVEMDSEMVAVARNRLDNVICGDIEALADQGGLGTYDCIVCGDVLEHLRNPWKVVKGLKSHLRRGGLFIASTPNIMNWAIILDQMKGRWDYVPFSILSGTHIRFFTKGTFTDLFEGAGYTIKDVLLQSLEIPRRGVEFIAGLTNISSGMNEEELRASEIILIAEG